MDHNLNFSPRNVKIELKSAIFQSLEAFLQKAEKFKSLFSDGKPQGWDDFFL